MGAFAVKVGFRVVAPVLALHCVSCTSLEGRTPHAKFVLGQGGHPFPVTEQTIEKARERDPDMIHEITRVYLRPDRDLVVCFHGSTKDAPAARPYHLRVPLPPLPAAARGKPAGGSHIVDVPRRDWQPGLPVFEDLESQGFVPIPWNNEEISVSDPADALQTLRIPAHAPGGVRRVSGNTIVFVGTTDPGPAKRNVRAVMIRTGENRKNAILYYPMVPFAALADTTFTAGSAAGYVAGVVVSAMFYGYAGVPPPWL